MPIPDTDSRSLAKASKWHQPCWAVCGECDYLGCSAFALSSSLPWVAQGLNHKGAHGARCWMWSIVFFVLLVPIAFMGFGHTSKTECINHIGQDGEVFVEGEEEVIKLNKLCATRHRFNVLAITLCIAATAIGWTAWSLIGWINRMNIRTKYNLPGHCCSDFLLWVLCPSCALCQETRTIMKHSIQDSFQRSAPPASLGAPPGVHRRPDSVEDLPL